MEKIVDTNAWYNRIEEFIGVVLLFVMLFAMTWQVVLRFCFNTGNTWSEELSRYCYVWFTLITVSYALLNNAHIKIEAAMAVFPKKWHKYVVALGLLVIIFYCVVFVYYGMIFVIDNLRMDQVSLGLKVTMGYVYMILPLSHFLIGIRAIQRLILIFLGEDITAPDEAEEAIKAASKDFPEDSNAALEADEKVELEEALATEKEAEKQPGGDA